jgi:hypothetical protein
MLSRLQIRKREQIRTLQSKTSVCSMDAYKQSMLGDSLSLLTPRKFPALLHREFAAMARRVRQISGLPRRVMTRIADLSL